MPERLKVALVGAEGAGKTSLSKYLGNPAGDKSPGVLFITEMPVDIVDVPLPNRDILQIWGFSGQKQFKYLLDPLIKNMDFKGVAYVFNTGKPETLKELDYYVKKVRGLINKPSEILIGNMPTNKLGDSYAEPIPVDKEMRESIDKFISDKFDPEAHHNKIPLYFELSALSEIRTIENAFSVLYLDIKNKSVENETVKKQQ